VPSQRILRLLHSTQALLVEMRLEPVDRPGRDGSEPSTRARDPMGVVWNDVNMSVSTSSMRLRTI
jgi:hypothetical protein